MAIKETLSDVISENRRLRLWLSVAVIATALLAGALSIPRRQEVWMEHSDGRIERGGQVIWDWRPEDVARRVISATYLPSTQNRKEILFSFYPKGLAQYALEAKGYELVAFEKFNVSNSSITQEVHITAHVSLIGSLGTDRKIMEMTLQPAERTPGNPFGFIFSSVSSRPAEKEGADTTAPNP